MKKVDSDKNVKWIESGIFKYCAEYRAAYTGVMDAIDEIESILDNSLGIEADNLILDRIAILKKRIQDSPFYKHIKDDLDDFNYYLKLLLSENSRKEVMMNELYRSLSNIQNIVAYIHERLP
jgi:hypothetical protein